MKTLKHVQTALDSVNKAMDKNQILLHKNGLINTKHKEELRKQLNVLYIAKAELRTTIINLNKL